MSHDTAKAGAGSIGTDIHELRGVRVILDFDLARLYGVATARLNQQFRRNRARFPVDFAIELTTADLGNLMLQNATSRSAWGGRRKAPVAFTEHGAIMAASVLNSQRAVEMSVYVVRAFVRMRHIASTNAALASSLSELRKSVAILDAKTGRQFDQVYEAILSLMASDTRRQ